MTIAELKQLKESENKVEVKGKIKGAKYSLANKYADLRGDVLISTAIAELRTKYE